MFKSSKLLLCSALFVNALASSSPVVKLAYGSFQGNNTSDGLDLFLGIPFAAPPVGDLRFAYAAPPTPFQGVRQAVSFGAACPQQDLITPPRLPFTFPPPKQANSEDCLFINVYRPAFIPAGKKLPVIFSQGHSRLRILLGGFQIGDSSLLVGSDLVKRSVALNASVIYVSSNYRLNAFGFLGGKEIQEAGIGNAGFQDQVVALEWVQKYISEFGGDRERVTIWGESAGSISVALHILANDGNSNDLFSGAIMDSGFTIPLPEVESRQSWFDLMTDSTSCSNSTDRLGCLRGVPWEQLLAAVNQTPNFLQYTSVNITWGPMIDGKLIARDPRVSLLEGKYAKIPFIVGDDKDEGTRLSPIQHDPTDDASRTEPQFFEYVKSNFLPNVTDAQLKAIALAYPEDPAQGSPFDTGSAYALTPEFKRIAAFQGDLFFHGPRRNFLRILSKTQPGYAFLYSRVTIPEIGAFHSSELPELHGQANGTNFAGVDFVESSVFFTNNGNPNAPKDSISHLSNITWDKWSSSNKNPPVLNFLDPTPSVEITFDNFRNDSIQLLIELTALGPQLAMRKRGHCQIWADFVANKSLADVKLKGGNCLLTRGKRAVRDLVGRLEAASLAFLLGGDVCRGRRIAGSIAVLGREEGPAIATAEEPGIAEEPA
ncbi:Alpha/Beta hydrolase protein [Crepidotus variabilis]|uniref:Carboxylic ester hydrolase n=1 Tax=Crepidotus variabilis TaxID=179855 RepID=A0A9P6EHR1_9AGAR|nr:Alpha/Beta hydrolase protein [Crepidotus variabilis]